MLLTFPISVISPKENENEGKVEFSWRSFVSEREFSLLLCFNWVEEYILLVAFLRNYLRSNQVGDFVKSEHPIQVLDNS